ncbi:MAG: DUF3291 domain-containing protein [Acidimicrobiia bacterium]
MNHHLAQLNIARLYQPLDHPDTAEFVAALDGINKLAESSPGFVWRLQDEDGRSSSYVAAYEDPLVVINLSVWEDVESLRSFTYRSDHTPFFRRRREWFEAHAEPYLVCWWLPAGEIPTVEDAVRRLDLLRVSGPGPEAFTLAAPLPPPG